MRFRRGAKRVIYLGENESVVERPAMLAMVQGKTISQGKQILSQYEKTTVQEWTDREGTVAAHTFGDMVLAMDIKPADADAQRADFLRRLREAQAKVARPDATPQDMAEAMALQIEYMEFLALLDD